MPLQALILVLGLLVCAPARAESVSNYGYCGREADAGSINYHRARYYDTQLGRYLQRDPLGLTAGVNDYAYVAGDPLSRCDPGGMIDDATGRLLYEAPPEVGSNDIALDTATAARINKSMANRQAVPAYAAPAVVGASMAGAGILGFGLPAVPMLSASAVSAGVWVAGLAPIKLFLAQEVAETPIWQMLLRHPDFAGRVPSAFGYVWHLTGALRDTAELISELEMRMYMAGPRAESASSAVAAALDSARKLQDVLANARADAWTTFVTAQLPAGLGLAGSGAALGLYWRSGHTDKAPSDR